MMTKPMEDFFNLPSSTPEVEENTLPVKTKEELLSEARQIYSSLSTTEKVEQALTTVVGLDEHDTEMDDIASKAVKTFEDLVALGNNVNDRDAGKIFEVAGQMLKTALEAKNSKAERKLKMIELQIKKVRAEQIDFELGLSDKKSKNQEFDRNELLRYLVSTKTENSDK